MPQPAHNIDIISPSCKFFTVLIWVPLRLYFFTSKDKRYAISKCRCTVWNYSLFAKPPPKTTCYMDSTMPLFAISICNSSAWSVILIFWTPQMCCCVRAAYMDTQVFKLYWSIFLVVYKFKGNGVWTCLLILTSAYYARVCKGGSVLYALFCNLCTKYISNIFCCRTGNVRVLPQKCNGWLFEYLHNATIFWTLTMWCTADNMCIF